MIEQKTFGAFIAERYGPKWVYAHRRSDRIAHQYPNSAVITPKQQRDLARDYKTEWGREHDPEFWQMLCALRNNRLMLYAWKGARAKMGLPDDHGELNASIAEVEAAIKAATS